MSENIKKKSGRPNKHGLVYNPVYASLFSNPKMQKAEDMVDPSGKNMDDRLLVDKMVIRFFSYIFSRGYYIAWNEDAEKDICKEIGNGMNPIRLRIYLRALLQVGFLSNKLYEQYQILTSRGIQQKWLQVMKLSRRNKILIDERYFIESQKNDFLRDGTVISSRRNKGKLPNKSDINSKSTDINTQNNDNTEFIPEESAINSRSNTNNTPKQGGVSFFNNSNSILDNKGSIDNTDTNININEKVPEESAINSGSNANNSRNDHEEIGKIPPNGIFPPEKSNNSSGRNYEITIPPSSQVLFPLETCKWNYLHNNKFEITVSQHITQLHVLHWLQDDKRLLRAWLDAFNRYNIDEGIYERSFNGSNGYAKHFKNWVNKRPDYLQTDPNSLFINMQNGNKQQESNGFTGGNSTKKPIERVGGVSRESIDRLREAKRNRGNSNSTT